MGDAATDVEMAMDSSHSDSYRPDIDGLRAVAVLAVMIYHADKAWLPGGFLGVDVFFVISGYVVTHSLAQYVGKKSSDGGIFFSFYARRAKRLLPASLFMIGLTGLLIGVFIPGWTPRKHRYFTSGRFALISWANNYFAGLETSYFDTGKSFLEVNPYTHTWSLGVEEQFYFLFPLVLMLAYGGSLQTLPKAGQGFQLWPMVVLGGVSACSMMAALTLPSDTAFFILPSRLWELAAGALLFQVLSSCGNAGMRIGVWQQQMASAVLQLSAVILVSFSLIHYPPDGTQFSLPVILPAVCGALCFIAAGSMPSAYLNNCLSHSLFVYIGKLSYPLYLMHWPVMVFCMWGFGFELVRTKLLCLAASVLLGAFTYHVVEGPFRAWRPTRSWMVLLMMGMGVLAVYGWLTAVERHQRHMWVPVEYSTQPHELFSEPHVFQGLGGFQSNRAACGCQQVNTTWHKPPCAKEGESAKSLPPCFREIPPTALRCQSTWCSVKGESWGRGENQQKEDPGENQEQACSNGSCLMLTRRSKSNTIFLLGDSSARNVYAGLREATLGQFYVRQLARGGCQYGPPNPESGPPEKECIEHIKNATAEVLSSFEAGDLVAVSNMWILNGVNSDAWFSQFSKMVDVLHKGISAHDGKILIFGPRVILPSDGVECVPTVFKKTNPMKCERSLADVNETLKPLRNRLAKVKHSKDGIELFDYQELLCDDRTCGAFVPGTKTLAFSDHFHLTAPGSIYLAPFICDFLNLHDLISEKATPESAIQIGGRKGRAFLRQSRSNLISRR